MKRVLSRNVVESVFRRRGKVTERSGPFRELAESFRSEILRDFVLEIGEDPIVASIDSPTRWTLVTTVRIVSRRDEVFLSVDYGQLADARGVIEGVPSMDSVNQIALHLESGAIELISVEPGGPFFGFLNILKHAARPATRARSK